jgi:xanthine dehydrogenase accessory factor
VDAQGGNAVVITDPATFNVAESVEIEALLAPGHSGQPEAGAEAGRNTRAMLAAAAQLEPLLRGGRTGLVRLAPQDGCLSGGAGSTEDGTESLPEPVTLLVESRLPPARMLVFGANDFSAALLPAAKLLGYRVTVCDARPAFAGQDRFSGADEIVTDWPHRYLAAEAAAGRIDSRTVICVLTHDPKFDVPLLATALALDVAYVGAMGSRQSHRRRVESLLADGVSVESLAALHSPIGLDLGAVTPAEVAVSVTAELVASLNRRDQPGIGPLKDGSGPIHHYLTSTTATPTTATMPDLKEASWT